MFIFNSEKARFFQKNFFSAKINIYNYSGIFVLNSSEIMFCGGLNNRGDFISKISIKLNLVNNKET